MDLFEVIAGSGPPPSFVLELVRYLPQGSACEAAQNNAPGMVGYDATAKLLTNISDYVQVSMIVAGNWPKGKGPKFQPAVRPWVEAKKHASTSQSDSLSISDMHKIFANKADQR